MTNLFKRISGRAVFDSAVDRFYDYMLTDHRAQRFFAKVNMEKQGRLKKFFIPYVLGGSAEHEGNDLRSERRHLVDRMGLSDEHFDAAVENLLTTMRDLNVPGDLIEAAG